MLLNIETLDSGLHSFALLRNVLIPEIERLTYTESVTGLESLDLLSETRFPLFSSAKKLFITRHCSVCY